MKWPYSGLAFGVGLRRPHFDEIGDNHEGVDFLEIISENFMRFGGRPRHVLDRMIERFPIVLHGVSLSIGSLDPLNEDYLHALKDVVGRVRPPWFSDHLSYSSNFGVEYHDLIPLPFTEEALEHVVRRVERVQETVGIPFLLENPSYYVQMPGGEMTEAEFISEVVRRSGCGLLLDVNNVFVNGTNQGYDPYRFIDSIPTDRVVQYHIAGHDDSGDFLIDTHGRRIKPEVYDLYVYALSKTGPKWTLLEWDNDIPPLKTLLAENGHVRKAGEGVFSQRPAAVR
ncbi:MAG: DUF692 domain-containing protein [Myxococcales bacterium]|nr:MAG: DUF692 domain-containing protein [Myxococcales bacterium]